jgi:hypothetical protein
VRTVIAALLLAGCVDHSWEWAPAWIEFGDDKPNLVAPASVARGESFAVTFNTYLGGCEEFAFVGVDETDDQIEIRPINVVHHGSGKCAQILRHLSHSVTVKFEHPGEKLIQLQGLRSILRSEEEITVPFTLSVD